MKCSYFRFNGSNIHDGTLNVCKKCKTSFELRNTKLKEIIESKNSKRLIVAGPGTGKTHTFKKVVESMTGSKNVLIFTFINNLADDLKKEFTDPKFEKVNVGTFHSYCKSLLYSKLGSKKEYYPNLSILIEEDARYLNLNHTKKQYHDAVANLDINNSMMDFFFSRSDYYKSISHDDAVYAVYSYLLKNKEAIPKYDLVIADEYQDFNKLEASFINLIAEKNSVLIAGDDDQALYGFRNSSTDFIRDLYTDPSYEKFNLPFTSRCTNVIERAIKKIIEIMSSNGRLINRIPKDYMSYWPDKYIHDKKYSHIQVAKCSKPKTAELYIKNRIQRLVDHDGLTGNETDIQFLIIGSESQHRLDALGKYLKSSLDNGKFNIITKEEEKPNDLPFAYNLINRNRENNLGWRILMHYEPPINVIEIIRKSHQNQESIFNLLSQEYVDKHLKIIKDFFINPAKSETVEATDSSENKKINIKLTNCLGSKGLSALHVIVLEFHNGVMPFDKQGQQIDDVDIFRCIVTLTRSKRSCVLVTFKEYDNNSQKTISRDSKFLEIIPNDCLVTSSFKIVSGALIKYT